MTLGLTVKTLGTIIELFIPYILSCIIDFFVPSGSVGMILLGGGAMMFCAFAGVTLNVSANRMAAGVAKDIAEVLRRDLFSKTMRLSGAQVDRFTIPSLEARLTSDTYYFHSFISSIQRMGVRAPIMLIGGLAVTMFIDWRMSIVMLLILPFITLSVLLITKHGVPLYSEVQRSVDGMTRIVREDSQGIRVIKSLAKTDYERMRFDASNRHLSRSERFAGIVMAASNPVMSFLMNLGIVSVIFIGAILVNKGISMPGRIIAFTQYFTLISQAMMGITRMFVMYTKASASAQRISEVLTTGEDLPVLSASEIPAASSSEDGYIVFDKVSFSYNKTKNNLTDISFSVRQGGSLGIIGATGSGKSTIIRLLMRFYDVDSGSIIIGGRDVRTIPPEELHSYFGAALQNDFLFADTIEENVRFGREIRFDGLKAAASIAQAEEFIDRFEDGWQHMLTSKGTNISGGQRQRLLISRALAGEPEILILDDSSSALDYKTDAQLRAGISRARAGMTVIVVAQRISSVMNSDHILVLDEGRIIGSGTHNELMGSCTEYREISVSQMGGAFNE